MDGVDDGLTAKRKMGRMWMPRQEGDQRGLACLQAG